MTRKFVVVEKPRKERHHKCIHPGWLSRTLRGFKVGTVIKCRCGKYRLLDRKYGDLYWRTLYGYELTTYESGVKSWRKESR